MAELCRGAKKTNAKMKVLTARRAVGNRVVIEKFIASVNTMRWEATFGQSHVPPFDFVVEFDDVSFIREKIPESLFEWGIPR